MRTHHGIWPGANRQHPPARGPGIKATQVQFIKQFSMSLPNGTLGVWGSWDSSAASSNCSSSGGLGTGNAATTLANGVFFWRICEYAVLFLTTATAFLLPCHNLVYVFYTVRPRGKVHKACTMTLMCSPVQALPAFTGMTQDEKGSMVSAFWVYINWS